MRGVRTPDRRRSEPRPGRPHSPHVFFVLAARGLPHFSGRVKSHFGSGNDGQSLFIRERAAWTMTKTKGEQFAGVTVAIITPFRDGEVDFPALRRLVDWHVEQGTDGLAPAGTTGESPTLDHEEHERIIAAVVEQAAGRIKVMAGTGSNSTREAIRLTRSAQRAGADGALMVGPYYNKPTQEGYYPPFRGRGRGRAICPSCSTTSPAAPAPTSCRKPSADWRRSRPSWRSRKPPARWTRRRRSRRCATSRILSGDDSLTLPLMSVGGRGVVSVVGNIVPRDLKALVTAFDGRQGPRSARMAPQALPRCAAICSAWPPIRSLSRRP